MSDEDKVRLQLLLDARQFSAECGKWLNSSDEKIEDRISWISELYSLFKEYNLDGNL